MNEAVAKIWPAYQSFGRWHFPQNKLMKNFKSSQQIATDVIKSVLKIGNFD